MENLEYNFDSKNTEWVDTTIYFNGSPLTKTRRVCHVWDKDHFRGAITLLNGVIDDMNRAAIATGGDDCTDIVFDIAMVYKVKGLIPLQNQTLVGVTIPALPENIYQDAKTAEVTLPVKIKSIHL